MKYTKPLFFAALFLIGLGQCGSQNATSKSAAPLVVNSYYIVQVGGTPSAGLTRSFFMVLDTLPEATQINTLQVNGRELALKKSALRNTVIGVEEYAVKDSLPVTQLKLVLIYQGKEQTILSKKPELKETVYFQSVPPQD
jgi:hypothetical protein